MWTTQNENQLGRASHVRLPPLGVHGEYDDSLGRAGAWRGVSNLPRIHGCPALARGLAPIQSNKCDSVP